MMALFRTAFFSRCISLSSFAFLVKSFRHMPKRVADSLHDRVRQLDFRLALVLNRQVRTDEVQSGSGRHVLVESPIPILIITIIIAPARYGVRHFKESPKPTRSELFPINTCAHQRVAEGRREVDADKGVAATTVGFSNGNLDDVRQTMMGLFHLLVPESVLRDSTSPVGKTSLEMVLADAAEHGWLRRRTDNLLHPLKQIIYQVIAFIEITESLNFWKLVANSLCVAVRLQTAKFPDEITQELVLTANTARVSHVREDQTCQCPLVIPVWRSGIGGKEL